MKQIHFGALPTGIRRWKVTWMSHLQIWVRLRFTTSSFFCNLHICWYYGLFSLDGGRDYWMAPRGAVPQVLCEWLLKKRLSVGKNTPVFSPMGQTFASLLLTLIVSNMLLVKAKRSLKLEMMELTRQVLLWRIFLAASLGLWLLSNLSQIYQETTHICKDAIHFGIPIGCKHSDNLDFYGKLGIWKNCIF